MWYKKKTIFTHSVNKTTRERDNIDKNNNWDKTYNIYNIVKNGNQRILYSQNRKLGIIKSTFGLSKRKTKHDNNIEQIYSLRN